MDFRAKGYRHFQLCEKLGSILLEQQKVLVTAESCTGGGIASAITDIAGSSAWFDRAFITYSNEAKMEMLGVEQRTLQEHGAVSQQVVKQMALGALEYSNGTVSIAVSGIAGPAGGSEDKPVGTVWFAWKVANGVEHQQQKCFSGDRITVREKAVEYAITKLIELLSE